jgi:secondary thiamine-phosphate synthase enzyme
MAETPSGKEAGAAPVSRFEVRTSRREEWVDVTEDVAGAVTASGIVDGLVVLWSLHTTAALTVNEAADPDVARDVSGWLARNVPDDPAFRHAEGNSDAHVKTSLMGPGVTLIVEGGRLLLGRWQGVFLCEFDGPRTRTVCVRVVGG